MACNLNDNNTKLGGVVVLLVYKSDNADYKFFWVSPVI